MAITSSRMLTDSHRKVPPASRIYHSYCSLTTVGKATSAPAPQFHSGFIDERKVLLDTFSREPFETLKSQIVDSSAIPIIWVACVFNFFSKLAVGHWECLLRLYDWLYAIKTLWPHQLIQCKFWMLFYQLQPYGSGYHFSRDFCSGLPRSSSQSSKKCHCFLPQPRRSIISSLEGVIESLHVKC